MRVSVAAAAPAAPGDCAPGEARTRKLTQILKDLDYAYGYARACVFVCEEKIYIYICIKHTCIHTHCICTSSRAPRDRKHEREKVKERERQEERGKEKGRERAKAIQ